MTQLLDSCQLESGALIGILWHDRGMSKGYVHEQPQERTENGSSCSVLCRLASTANQG